MELTPRKYTVTEQKMLTDAALTILTALVPMHSVAMLTEHSKVMREERVKLAFAYAEEVLRATGLVK